MENGVRCILAFCRSAGTRAAYLENEDTRALFEILLLLDRLCIEAKIMQPTGGQYLMRPKPVNEIPAKPARVGEESGAKIPKSSVAAPLA